MEAITDTEGEYKHNRDVSLSEKDQPWFDVGDLARRYKTSVRHIYRMADGGRMPWGVKLGQLRRWSRHEIEDWEVGGCAPVEPPRNAAVCAKPGKGGRHG